MTGTLGIQWGDFLQSEQALDPYLIWADATGFAATGGVTSDGTLPFLIEAEENALTGKDLPKLLDDRPVALAYLNGGKGSRFFTADVPVGSVASLVQERSILGFQLSAPRSAGLPSRGVSNPDRAPVGIPPGTGGGRNQMGPVSTVVGIIDDGCPFAHRNLSDDQDRTRVRFLWDQGAESIAQGDLWTPVAELARGLEVKGEALDAYTDAFGRGRVYPALGIDRITGRVRTHGNAICHLAAGRRVPVDLDGRRGLEDDASDLPIVFVQLPLSTVADTTGGSIGFHVLDALHYIYARAMDLAKDGSVPGLIPRVVINLSYGSVAGPHDGTSLVERALVSFLQAHEQVSLVVAAGNSNRDPVHRAFAVPPHSDRTTIEMTIGPDHGLESYLEIWWPESVDLRPVEIQLWAPGESQPTASARWGTAAYDDRSNPRCGVVFCKAVAQGQRGTMTLVAIRPTRGQKAACPGHWRVKVINRGDGAIEAVHAWMERNDVVLGRRRGQQAKLLDPSPKTGAATNMVLASMSNIDSEGEFHRYSNRYLVVGASKVVDRRRSDYSSTGPTTDQRRLGPDGLAPADIGTATRGLLVDGPFDGQWTRATGSSAAAAVTSRRLAADCERATVSGSKGYPSSTPSKGIIVTFPRPDHDGWFRIECASRSQPFKDRSVPSPEGSLEAPPNLRGGNKHVKA